MTELSRDAKSLIALSRGGVDPSPADRERVRAKLAPAWSAQQRALDAHGFRVRRGAWMTRYGVWIALAWLHPSLPATRLQEPVATVSGGATAAGDDARRSSPESEAIAANGGSQRAAMNSVASARRSAARSAEESCARLEAELRAAAGDDLRLMRARFAAECPRPSSGERAHVNARASAPRSDATACELASSGGAARAECKRSNARGAAAGACDASSASGECKRSNARGAAAGACDASSASGECKRSNARAEASPCGSPECARRATNDARSPAHPPRPSVADSGEAAAWSREAFVSTTSSDLHVHLAAPEQGGPSIALQPIDDELELLSSAQDALRRGQPSQALRLVQQHAFRFPRGALAQERSVVQALALCALDRRSAARVIIEDMKQRAPTSPLLTSVRRACGL